LQAIPAGIACKYVPIAAREDKTHAVRRTRLWEKNNTCDDRALPRRSTLNRRLESLSTASTGKPSDNGDRRTTSEWRVDIES
jgi:hypothetical protein